MSGRQVNIGVTTTPHCSAALEDLNAGDRYSESIGDFYSPYSPSVSLFYWMTLQCPSCSIGSNSKTEHPHGTTDVRTNVYDQEHETWLQLEGMHVGGWLCVWCVKSGTVPIEIFHHCIGIAETKMWCPSTTTPTPTTAQSQQQPIGLSTPAVV